MDLESVLIGLCSLAGPSGFEEPVAERVKTLLEPLMDEIRSDVMGNVTGVRRCGKEGARKLLFDAHIDEPGLIITGAEEGFLRFAALGGSDARVLPASGITIQTDPPIYGVVGVLPPHVLKKEDSEKAAKIEDLFIDAGLDQEEAVRNVPQGTPAVLAHGARRLLNDKLCGKALDDRAGLAAVILALEMLRDAPLDVDLYVMASVQEEVGRRGAAPGVFAIAPELCIAVDAGHAKTPDSKPAETGETLGGGVIISRGPNMNAALTETVIGLAREKNISHQIRVKPGGDSGTNARVIQISGEGVATALLSIPTRYMHGAHEVVSLEDVGSTASLLAETAKSLS